MRENVIKIEVDKNSLQDIQRQLKKIPEAIRNERLRDINLAAAQPLIQSARQKAPVKTRDLQKSIGVVKRLSKGPAIFVGPDRKKGFHGGWVEFGSFNRKTKKMNTPKPFMRPAFDETKDRVQRIQIQGIMTLINQAIK
jgi:HK97 gp10 family phage protein